MDLRDIRKTYRGRIEALRGISIDVRRGEIFGLLGPNGAGKSTLVKIIMTIVRPSRSQGTVLDAPLGDRNTLRRVGYLPESHRFPPYLTGRQALDYYGALARVPRRERRRRIGPLLDLVGMSDWASKRVSQYSKGMQQRIGLAQSLINDPDLVFLDEPTDGVDPVGRREIRESLNRLREEGRTIFLNSHLLHEVEMVCDRVAILDRGEVIRVGSIDELSSDSARFEIEFAGPAPAWAAEAKETTLVESRDDRTTMTLSCRDAVEAQPVLDRLRSDGVVIRRFTPRADSLEELFMKIVERSEGAPPAEPSATEETA
ncbi:MAG: ATP-binding cassette domain-containing protein [Phycisphaerales bacterium]